MTDVLEFLAPSLDFMMENHLVDPVTNQPQYTMVTPNMIWYPKNDPPKTGQQLLGFDGNPIDRFYNIIRQQLTELDWKGNYKCFLNGGIPWMQRYVDFSLTDQPELFTTDSDYVQVVNNVPAPKQNLKNVSTKLYGIFKGINFGGDVGVQDCVQNIFLWDSGAVRERYYYVGPNTFGWVRWDTSNLINGQYVIKQTSNFNKIAKGGFGAVNFTGVIPA